MDAHEKPAGSGVEFHQPLLGAKYVSIERRSLPGDTVFIVDDIPFRSSMPKPTHWSIAWSDLMMTMFVLFLSMYVYKAANQDFLNKKGLEVIGGDTSAALEMDQFNPKAPFAPISPSLPLMTAGTVKKAESINLRDIDVDDAFSTITEKTKIEKEIVEIPTDRVIPRAEEQEKNATVVQSPGEAPAEQEMVEPRPLTPAGPSKPDNIQEIYRLSKAALETNDLKSFAAIDLIPDNTMRIILTGDLVFGTGQAVITPESRTRLEQLATSIQTTPYMINVVGHTDNVPMYSDRYASNWELSVARASTVARFLIEDMGMNPNQFVVSGYASYRPLVPNTTADNRKINRRVEIIISKRLPNPVPADQQNLN